MVDVVRDEAVRSGAPRLEGTRISVLDVKRRVLDEGEQPHVVAGEFDVAVADLFRALAYYYENREEFQRRERVERSTRADGEERTQTVLPAQ